MGKVKTLIGMLTKKQHLPPKTNTTFYSAKPGRPFKVSIPFRSFATIKVQRLQKGDCLKVKVLNIIVEKKGFIPVNANSTALKSRKLRSKMIGFGIKNSRVLFGNEIELPVAPNIGVIGLMMVSDLYDIGMPKANCGGNMDCPYIRRGSTIYLPALNDDVFLVVGDIHALQGEGEVSGGGVEIGATLIFRAEIMAKKKINQPIIEYGKNIYVVGVGENLEEAADQALSYASKTLCRKFGFGSEKAMMLLSVASNIRLCQMVNRKISVVNEIPKKILNANDFV